MEIADIIAKARVLLEALPYIQDFHGSIFVVKYGGSFMDDPDPTVRMSVATDIAFLAAVGINVVVVHGGGKAINRAMEGSGLKANFINGLRVTDAATIAIVKKTLDEIVNKDVCDTLTAVKARPKGLPGDSVIVCDKLRADDDGNPCDLGFVGDVTEVKVKLIKKEIADGFMPVISPVAEGLDGKPYNVNADTVAESLAVALRAQKLIFLTGAPGVLRDRADPSTLVTFADPDDLAGLMANGVLTGGMRPKVEACIRAATGGVERTHIIDGRVHDSLLLEVFTGSGAGTMIVGRKEKATYIGVDLAT